MKKNNSKAFTLVEILISTVIIASILTAWFYAITFITVGKIRLVESTKIEKEGFYFSEKLFEMIKSWGELDFEEYFNRSIVWNTSFFAGHYDTPSGYGNFWFTGVPESWTYGSSLYYCVSWVGAANSVGTDGCVNAYNSDWENHSAEPQRYGQYAAQFIDYNSDFDNDTAQCAGAGPLGDEDCNGEFIGDDDDVFLWQGPSVFAVNSNIHELYLISGDKQTRTYFRWNVWEDPDRPTTETCDFSDQSNPVWDGCLGTIEFIVLDGRDWWDDHDEATVDANGSQYDGTIDTWIVNSRFSGNDTTIAGAQTTSYWEKLFPDDISVSGFEVYAFPHKDINLAWKESNSTINQAPYVRMKMTLSPSWEKRKIIRWTVPRVEIATTIALTDEFSQ